MRREIRILRYPVADMTYYKLEYQEKISMPLNQAELLMALAQLLIVGPKAIEWDPDVVDASFEEVFPPEPEWKRKLAAKRAMTRPPELVEITKYRNPKRTYQKRMARRVKVARGVAKRLQHEAFFKTLTYTIKAVDKNGDEVIVAGMDHAPGEYCFNLPRQEVLGHLEVQEITPIGCVPLIESQIQDRLQREPQHSIFKMNAVHNTKSIGERIKSMTEWMAKSLGIRPEDLKGGPETGTEAGQMMAPVPVPRCPACRYTLQHGTCQNWDCGLWRKDEAGRVVMPSRTTGKSEHGPESFKQEMLGVWPPEEQGEYAHVPKNTVSMKDNEKLVKDFQASHVALTADGYRIGGTARRSSDIPGTENRRFSSPEINDIHR